MYSCILKKKKLRKIAKSNPYESRSKTGGKQTAKMLNILMN